MGGGVGRSTSITAHARRRAYWFTGAARASAASVRPVLARVEGLTPCHSPRECGNSRCREFSSIEPPIRSHGPRVSSRDTPPERTPCAVLFPSLQLGSLEPKPRVAPLVGLEGHHVAGPRVHELDRDRRLRSGL